MPTQAKSGATAIKDAAPRLHVKVLRVQPLLHLLQEEPRAPLLRVLRRQAPPPIVAPLAAQLVVERRRRAGADAGGPRRFGGGEEGVAAEAPELRLCIGVTEDHGDHCGKRERNAESWRNWWTIIWTIAVQGSSSRSVLGRQAADQMS